MDKSDFDYPKWLRFWKKGRRGIHFYYILWQVGAYFKIKGLHKQIHFSIAHHITFVNSWLPSILSWLNIPFVWGPIGCHQIPLSLPLLREFGFLGAIKEILRRIIYKIAEINPLLKKTFKNADKIIVINRLIYDQNKKYQSKMIISPAIAISDDILRKYEVVNFNTREIVVLFGGIATYWKGLTLAVKAFIESSKTNDNTRLVIAGSGPLLEKAKDLLKNSQLDSRATILGHLPRHIFLNYLASCDIFLYPSFEGGGLVVLEAMALNKPVICLEWGGPGEFVTNECGVRVNVTHPTKMIHDLSEALNTLISDERLRITMGQAGNKRVKEVYDWDNIGKLIEGIYAAILR